MENDQVVLDLKMVHEIDDSSVDFPFGVGDFIEECLKQLDADRPLTTRQRTRVKKLLAIVKKHEERRQRTRELD